MYLLKQFECDMLQRDWVCDRAVLVAWSQAISFLGSIVGGISLGYFADMFGRIPALFGNNSYMYTNVKAGYRH